MKVELAKYLAEMTKNTRLKEWENAEQMLEKDPENKNLQKLVKQAKAKVEKDRELAGRFSSAFPYPLLFSGQIKGKKI